ncbi:hypothetical protein V6N13_049860 [Hibiscus sabdariffa]
MYELWTLAASIGSISARCSSVSYGIPNNAPYGGSCSVTDSRLLKNNDLGSSGINYQVKAKSLFQIL